MVNLPTAGVDYHVPFGGRKGSSYGPREQGRHAAEFYTAMKTAYTFRFREFSRPAALIDCRQPGASLLCFVQRRTGGEPL